MTEWVTIRVPEHVRTAGQMSEQTYGDLLALGVAAHKAGFDRHSDNGVGTESEDVGNGVDSKELAREVARQLDYAEISRQVARNVSEELR